MDAPYPSFQELQSEVDRMREAGDVVGALDLMTREADAFPDQAAYAYFWRVRLAGELGRIDEAVRVFAEALAAGCRYPLPVLRSELLTPLHEIVEFERLEHIAAMRYDAESAASRRKLVVRLPEGRDLVGMLLVLHGNNSRTDRTVPHWEHALELGWGLALAQSAEISWTPGMFVWNDPRLAHEQIVRHLEQIGPLDVPMVIAGHSMGALRALEFARTEPGGLRAAIAVGPYLPPGAVTPLADGLGLRTVLVVGERDEHGRPGAEELASRLRERDVPVRIEIVPGLGHAYPPDMPERLDAALAFVPPSYSLGVLPAAGV